MASCKKCGTNVGCGCQLINGLCAHCNALVKQTSQRINNVISKITQLY